MRRAYRSLMPVHAQPPSRLPSEPSALAAALPDTPRWVYARSALLSGEASVRLAVARDAGLVVDLTTAVLVGRPDVGLLRDALAEVPSGLTLLIEEEALPPARAALPDWTERPFVVHALACPHQPDLPPAPGVVVSAPLDPALLMGLPDDVRADAAGAPAAAVRVTGGRPVAVCTVSDLTERLWDVGINTVEPARRQGHATAVFHALTAAMAAQGQQPVWAAYEDYLPSLELAKRLGFRAVARMAELTPPDSTAAQSATAAAPVAPSSGSAV